ncbi:hypothetical protein [Metabacillus bambusae]|uniref:Phage protein n=1 Tax=Metabacillus bambusae TaxID=2795218 RepID=A0ABS3NA28_9BACI|nr:hypothetical protein [Metabacillus bambusae]MBO1515038.1 hypothetical protein [Metabacillus bambusae]
MQKSFQEQLKEWKKDHMEVKEQRKQTKKKPPAKNQEKLSESDLRFLMGSSMQTLRRGKGGAYK